jgi:hypothetical protein
MAGNPRRRWTVVLGTILLGGLAVGACGRKPLPPLSAIVDAPYLRPGSSWTYKVQDTTWSQPATVVMTFVKDDVYKNAGVLAFAAGSETILYDRDLNFVAVAAEGRILREASPSLRSFDFPFYVGKEWRSVFTFQDNQKGLSWTPVEVFWKVKEYDQIEVPAGKFRSFLLESAPSTNWGIRREQVWYAPEVKQPIKRIRERTAAHYEGKGTDTWELVQYSLK